jgi:two-component sensor histidine kinase
VPKPSLPVRLALLVAGTTLPLIIFAAAIVFEDYKRDREAASQRVIETVRGIRLVLDAEVERITSGLEVLAHTNALHDNNFESFRRVAAGFLEQYGEDGIMLIADREGRQLFSWSTRDTSSLPPRNNLDMVAKVFATKKPQYSNLFFGITKQRLIVTVEVPVLRDGEVVYDISFSPPMVMFQSILERQRPGEDWTISIFDREGVNIARAPNPKATIGKPSPLLFTAMVGAPEGALQTVSLEGLLLLTGLAFAVRMATTIARGDMLHNMLIEELNHRVKNTLAILQAIAVQTFQSASKSERETFEGRLGALAEAHNLLSEEKWRGSGLEDVVGRVLQPFVPNNPERVRMSGPPVPLPPRAAVIISMIVHEIATNAAKYGALSNETGTVRLDWEMIVDNGRSKLRWIWAESGGPPVSAPVKRGFGSRLIERSARDQLGGEATVDFLPRGVVYTLICALDDIG